MALVLKLGTLPKPTLNNITTQWLNISKEFDAGMLTDEVSYHKIIDVAESVVPETMSYIEQCYGAYYGEDDTRFERNYGFAVEPGLLDNITKNYVEGNFVITNDIPFFEAIKKMAVEVDHSKTWVFFCAERV